HFETEPPNERCFTTITNLIMSLYDNEGTECEKEASTYNTKTCSGRKYSISDCHETANRLCTSCLIVTVMVYCIGNTMTCLIVNKTQEGKEYSFGYRKRLELRVDDAR
ncbi:hypothetical protein ROZALSC1DRAFT_24729, partial [Rozella allomycis CSF55]